MNVNAQEDADDLFENFDAMPQELREICESYSDSLENCENLYAMCKEFLAKVEAIGYTFEYGLDGIPFDLKRIDERTKDRA